MKLSAREDIEAPLEQVFAALSDFEVWENAALRRGAEVTRTGRGGASGPAWQVAFRYRGKPRQMTIRLTGVDAPHRIGFAAQSANVEGTLTFELFQLSARRTRLTVVTEVRPRTLPARLVIQSIRLAKGRLQRRYADRVSRLCRAVERRLRGPAQPRLRSDG